MFQFQLKRVETDTFFYNTGLGREWKNTKFTIHLRVAIIDQGNVSSPFRNQSSRIFLLQLLGRLYMAQQLAPAYCLDYHIPHFPSQALSSISLWIIVEACILLTLWRLGRLWRGMLRLLLFVRVVVGVAIGVFV
jgi:hypothetical protein